MAYDNFSMLQPVPEQKLQVHSADMQGPPPIPDG